MWPRARSAMMLAMLALVAAGGAAQVQLFEVCDWSNPLSSRENRGRARDSDMMAYTHSASAAALGSATVEAWAAAPIERDSNH